jgi:hypothetical protein
MRKEITMNREVCKFMSGSFAALAYAHADTPSADEPNMQPESRLVSP